MLKSIKTVNLISLIFTILTFITTSVKAGANFNCPSTANTTSDTEYNVLLKTKSPEEALEQFKIIASCFGISDKLEELLSDIDTVDKCIESASVNIPSEPPSVPVGPPNIPVGHPNIPSKPSETPKIPLKSPATPKKRLDIPKANIIPNKSFRDLSLDSDYFAFSGFYSEEVVKALSEWDAVSRVDKAVEMKAFDLNDSNSSKTSNKNSSKPQRGITQENPVWNLDRCDQEHRPLDNKYTYPSCAGGDVDVYIVDTGIDIAHPEFEGRAKYGKSVCNYCLPCPMDDNGHGTHVAGIVASKTYGVAKNASLIAVKVINSAGSGSDSDVIKGLQYVCRRAAKTGRKSVVNMSLGGGVSQALNEAVEALTAKGINVVVAAGNDGGNACNVSPASAPSAIAVGSVKNTSDDSVSSFSDTGPCVPIYAPGEGILSTFVAGLVNHITATLSGTSMASPHVAGAVALYLCTFGRKSSSEMRALLTSTCDKNVIGNLPSNNSTNCLLRTPIIT
ncbi:37105_t:CDS:2 [Racocetra persica]|uniref:37105_t:CDS:1 n=1 Tax=Racocetra persica TaxID=160502 RepID=A0ACA9L4W9_9GLOM|nr:37105_t:CDS:2 [Racocetra persica]